MSNTVLKLKRSTTSGVTPTTGSLALGEVAINISDRKIWVGTGGETDAPVLISDYYGSLGGGSTYTEGIGINITTNNQIQLDLSNGLPTETSIDKHDYVPFLDVTSTGTVLGTKKVSARQFLQTGLSTSLSTAAYDGTNDQRTVISIQDQNPDAFSIKTLQNGTGAKLDILKIDTDVEIGRAHV